MQKVLIIFFFFLQGYLICFNPKTDIDKDGSQLSYCPLKHPFAVENGKGCCHAIMENIPLENFNEPCSMAKRYERGNYIYSFDTLTNEFKQVHVFF